MPVKREWKVEKRDGGKGTLSDESSCIGLMFLLLSPHNLHDVKGSFKGLVI